MNDDRHASAPEPGEGSFRQLLQRELARRCATNARYSLRSFARQLGVDHSTLSQILRGVRPVTPHTVRSLGAPLGLSEAAIDAFIAHERLFAAARDAVAEEMQQLTRDAMHVVTDWRHYAILELTHLEHFQPDVRWISRVLEAAPDDINVAIQRLLRLGLLEMSSVERWTDASAELISGAHEFSRAALARLLQQAHQLALEAAMQVDVLPPEPKPDEEE